MRLAPLLLILLCSCDVSEQIEKPKYSNPDQSRLHDIVNEYFDNQYNRDNDAKKKEYYDSCVARLDAYLTDSLKGKMMNFKVHIKTIEYRPWNESFALLMDCEDGDIKFWMEQHFKTESGMKGSGLYKLVTSLKQFHDTTLNLIYLPEAKIDKDKFLGYKAAIEVVPVPDSIALKYKVHK